MLPEYAREISPLRSSKKAQDMPNSPWRIKRSPRKQHTTTETLGGYNSARNTSADKASRNYASAE